ncbi:MAG: flagellar filament capping protein FliD, partial [Oscillospiraceae bacterium]
EQQKKQTLIWQQQQYRAITSSIQGFQKKYFDPLSNTNILSNKFFGDSSHGSSSSAIKVNSSSSSANDLKIDSVDQLATAGKVEGNIGISGGTGVEVAIDTAGVPSGDNYTLDVIINGSKKTISVPVGADSATLQASLDAAFGKDIVQGTVAADGKIKFDSINKATKITIGSTDENIKDKLTFTNTNSNRINTGSSLKNLGMTTTDTDLIKFSINDVAFEFKGDVSLDSVMSAINSSAAGVTMSYSTIDDKFSMTAKETGAGTDTIRITDDSGSTTDMMAKLLGTGGKISVTEGKNAIITVDGKTIVSTNNNFEIDGISFTALETTAANASINITKEKGNIDAMLKSVVGFIDDYNKLIDEMKKVTGQVSNRDYPPLTDEQRATLSPEEITKWEEKAKEGILFQDKNIGSVMSSFRGALYQPAGSGLSIYDIGIDISSDRTEAGKIIIDQDKLKKALTENLEGVKSILSAPDGVMSNLNKALNGAVATTGAVKGSLVVVAGTDRGTTNIDNDISKRISLVDQAIKTQKSRLAAEEKRYWAEFTRMEKYIQQMNEQSSALM